MSKYDKIKLENQLCFPLYALSREVIKLYKPLLDPFNLTYTQYITMLVIWEEEKINFKELAKRLYLDSGTLTPVIKKLEAMNLIIKYRNKEDDRVVTVELTDKGRELKDKVLEVPDKMLCNFKGDTENLLALKNYLDEMIASLEK
ncbi:MarR family winged helix-turn-helix transcriptional regulator [Clostridium isatidis]|uniref:MarR family transcriptional regulator n=1 Tax=Clostridium isatidis TaxID=182773 RepID=A0A343JF62_9CLOT|nr:MarR family transcriptional regulator [Clostridium isatidis]ASW44170.1 MarR family transcriptional regulator [Clostridium isatidis]NLZ34928.1 MarR family transcriptional regulator [Clostridiales bacterium]